MNEIKLVPGLFVKTGFNFEFSKEDKRLNILEPGISIEVYPKQIKIMGTENNPFIFPVLYLSYRFGKVESGYHLKEQDEGIIDCEANHFRIINIAGNNQIGELEMYTLFMHCFQSIKNRLESTTIQLTINTVVK